MFWRRKAQQQDLERELRTHLELETQAQLEAGLPVEEARHAARRALGSATRIGEEVRAVSGWVPWEHFLQDMRYAFRTFGRNPGFTAVAVLTMMLGIGVNTALFTLVNSVLFRSTPVSHPENFYELRAGGLMTTADFRLLQAEARTVRQLAASRWIIPILGGSGDTIHGNQISSNYFQDLGVHAAVGRLFTSDDTEDKDLIVLGDQFWTRQFHRDPSAIGQTVSLSGHRYTVIGVAEARFIGTIPVVAQFWTLLPTSPSAQPTPVRIAARLSPGVSRAQAEAELTALFSRNHPPKGPQPDRIVLTSRATFIPLNENTISLAALLTACVGLVLLIACANLANLLLARAAARQREIAIRLSVGASRARVVRQLLTESVLIAFLGGSAALVLSGWLLPSASRLLQSFLPPLAGTWSLHLAPDVRVFVYTFALCIAAGLLFGLAPALRATGSGVSEALKDGGGQGILWSRSRLRSTLVIAQVALCLILLTNAGLLARSLQNAQAADPGFETRHKIILQCDSEFDIAADRSGASPSHLLEKLSHHAGVVASAAAVNVPLLASAPAEVRVAGRSVPNIPVNRVTAGYFATIEIPIVRGRAFTEQEVSNDSPVIIISEGAAQKFFNGKDPIGQIVDSDGSRIVVGIARDTRSIRLAEVDPAYLYLPFPPRLLDRGGHLLFRTEPDAALLVGSIQNEAARLSSSQILVYTFDLALRFQRLPAQAGALVAATLGGLALLLAIVGIYGVISYTVSQRTREVGIRMALGAERSDVVGLILRQGMRLVIIGVVVGALGAAPLSYVLRFMLYGVAPLDPVAYAATPLLLGLMALLAMASPTIRASRVDPATTLRTGT